MSDEDADLDRLSSPQRAALRHVEERAVAQIVRAREALARILHDAGSADATFDLAMACVRRHARVVVHFHPDRFCSDGITVAEGLLRDGSRATVCSTPR